MSGFDSRLQHRREMNMGGTPGCPHDGGSKEGCWGCYGDLEEQRDEMLALLREVVEEDRYLADACIACADRIRALLARIDAKEPTP
jgi:hypothetical protein